MSQAPAPSDPSLAPSPPSPAPEPTAPTAPPSRGRAFLALLLLLPIPTLAVVDAMVYQLGLPGKEFFAFGKFWLFALPLGWALWVEKRKISWSPAKRGGFIPAIGFGLAAALLILLGFMAIRPMIDVAGVRAMAKSVGINSRGVIIAAAAYWCIANSLLEEYVWRWFVFTKLEELLAPGTAPAHTPGPSTRLSELQFRRQKEASTGWAIFLTAAFFTVHHVVALSTFLVWPLAALGSLGVFTGGVIWSVLYARYRSTWPGFVSHILADVAIFAGIWPLIFR